MWFHRPRGLRTSMPHQAPEAAQPTWPLDVAFALACQGWDATTFQFACTLLQHEAATVT